VSASVGGAEGRARGRTEPTYGGTDATQLTDTALVIGIGRRSYEAFAEVYSRHGGSVQALGARVCGSIHAEEVTQEVFGRLWRTPERYDPERGTLRTFLMAQAHARAVDRVRRGTAQRGRGWDDPASVLPTPVDPEITVMANTATVEVQRLVSRLPSPEGQAIGLAYFGCYTYQQVAELLGEAEATIKSRIRRGLSRLGSDTTGDGWPPRSQTAAPEPGR
jgi:RNA polymerase sigma-70 factor, ECF subfamily